MIVKKAAAALYTSPPGTLPTSNDFIVEYISDQWGEATLASASISVGTLLKTSLRGNVLRKLLAALHSSACGDAAGAAFNVQIHLGSPGVPFTRYL